MMRSPLRVAAAAFLVAIGAAIFAFAVSGNKAAQRDFISYWAAGQQLVRHANPYDQTAILQLERQAGYGGDRPLIMRNPPSALFLAVPLGFVSARIGLIAWSFLLLGSLIASVRMIWELHGRTADRLHLLGYCFAPVIACLISGQVGILLLLGCTIFLLFCESHPAVAGAALILCAIKPHLFLPFGLVLLAWAIRRRAFRMLAGFAIALLAACELAYFLDPLVWTHYAQTMAAAHIQEEFIPTLSSVLRILVGRLAGAQNVFLLQFLPAGVAILWAAGYFWKRRAVWTWNHQGLLVLLVSVVCAPYAWFSDEALLLPAVLAGLYRAQDSGRSLIPFGIVAGVALIEVLFGVPMTSAYYLWTAPAWLAWYAYATRGPVTELEVAN